jgi:murein DD-endopeptidase MepM/ murein hydrolase activator NlpD
VKWFVFLVVVMLTAAGATYYAAGRAAVPVIAILQPAVVGQTGTLDVTVDAPRGELEELSIALVQDGKTFPVLELPTAPAESISREGSDRLRVKGSIGRHTFPELRTGQAQITVSAARPVLWGLRTVSSRATRDVPVRLEPPRVSVVSTHHYINVGGAEFVVYRVNPPDVESGVRAGGIHYRGFPASSAGPSNDAALMLAVFAWPYNQAAGTPIELYAKDAAGNEARAQFDHRVFPKKFRRSTIQLDDGFLAKVVPPILQQSPELKVSADAGLSAFLKINNGLRRMNNETIAALAKQTAATAMWQGAFQPLGGAQVESAFADERTYVYGGKVVDQQVHLGFDLATTANAPVTAANDGKVIYAQPLGIYGNCIVLDHGLGVQSLYAHLSSFEVREGDSVRKGQALGHSGQTGLAAGDHLHFSMLVNGQFVNATEWWDPHWIEDRVTRKLRNAGLSPTAQPTAR